MESLAADEETFIAKVLINDTLWQRMLRAKISIISEITVWVSVTPSLPGT
jgi:hypothetical protein